MARGGKGGGMQLGAMSAVIVFMLGIVVYIALQMFVPTIAGTIENAQPELPADSDWNATYNTNLPNPVETYEDTSDMINLVIVVFLITMVIGALIGIAYWGR